MIYETMTESVISDRIPETKSGGSFRNRSMGTREQEAHQTLFCIFSFCPSPTRASTSRWVVKLNMLESKVPHSSDQTNPVCTIVDYADQADSRSGGGVFSMSYLESNCLLSSAAPAVDMLKT